MAKKKKRKIERRGFRPIYLPVSQFTHRTFSCFAILKGIYIEDKPDIEEMLSQLLFPYLRKKGGPTLKEDRPSYNRPTLKSAKYTRYLLHTSITAQLRRDYSRKSSELQRFLLGVVREELSKLDKIECLCGCGAIIDPFINPKYNTPRWFAAPSHRLRLDPIQALRPREKKYLKTLEEKGPLTIPEVSDLVGDTYKSTANFLSELYQLNIITKEGIGLYNVKKERSDANQTSEEEKEKAS